MCFKKKIASSLFVNDCSAPGLLWWGEGLGPSSYKKTVFRRGPGGL